MTVVKIHKDDDKIYGFSITGHAGFGIKGYDIVCSAISSTCIMTYNSILTYGVDSIDEIKHFNVKSHDAIAELIMHKHTMGDVTTALLKGFKDFVVELANMYPDYVTIEEVNSDDTN